MKKQRWEESAKRREEAEESETRKNQKKEDAGARKGSKVEKHCICSMICGSRGSKSRLAKAAGAEPSGQMRDEKLHAIAARSTCGSEKAENTSRPERFWKLRCWESARRCGAKHANYTTLHYITLHYTTLITLHCIYNYTTLHCTALGYTTLCYTTVHNTTVHCTTLHHYTTPQLQVNCN